METEKEIQHYPDCGHWCYDSGYLYPGTVFAADRTGSDLVYKSCDLHRAVCTWHETWHDQLPDLSSDRTCRRTGIFRIHRWTTEIIRTDRRISDRIYPDGSDRRHCDRQVHEKMGISACLR